MGKEKKKGEVGKQIVGEKKEIKKVGEKKKKWGQILNMFQKSENLKFSKYAHTQIWLRSKYDCGQIRLRSNMVAFEYGRTKR